MFQDFSDCFKDSARFQSVLEDIWSDILDFHIQALRIMNHKSMLLTRQPK